MNRLILLLAGSSLSDREIAKAMREVSIMSEYELFSAIEDLRSQNLKTQSRQVYTSDIFEQSYLSDSDRLVSDQISQMLRGDTGLTTLQASELLLDALRKHLPKSERDSLPALNKESFSTWVRKLVAIVSPSIVLHEAAKIRNSMAHYSTSDWPLGRR